MPASPEMTLPELSQFATELEDPMLVDNVFPEQPPPPFFFSATRKDTVPALYNKLNTYRFIQVSY